MNHDKLATFLTSVLIQLISAINWSHQNFITPVIFINITVPWINLFIHIFLFIHELTCSFSELKCCLTHFGKKHPDWPLKAQRKYHFVISQKPAHFYSRFQPLGVTRAPEWEWKSHVWQGEALKTVKISAGSHCLAGEPDSSFRARPRWPRSAQNDRKHIKYTSALSPATNS